MAKKPTYGELEKRIQELEKEVSQHKGLQKELRNSEERFNAFMNNSPATAFIKDEEGRLLYINPTFERAFGFEAMDWHGKTDFELWPLETADQLRKNDIAILNSGKPMALEEPVTQQDGEHFWLTYKFPFHDTTGSLYLAGIGIDFTDRKRDEEELKKHREDLEGLVEERTADIKLANVKLEQEITERRQVEKKKEESEKKYRELYEGCPDGYAMVDMEGRITEANSAFREMLGYTEEELRQKTTEEMTPEKWKALTEKIHEEQLLRRGCSDVYEKEYFRKDGTALPVEIRTYLIKDENGQPKGIWGWLRDITERKRAEAALRESEERYRSLFENSRDAIVMSSPDGKYIDINQAALDLFGYTRDEFLAVNAKETYANRGERGELLKAIELKGFAKDYEYRLKKKDGTEMICITTTTLRQSNDANRVEVQAIIRDITERKRAEEALTESEERYRSFVENFKGIAYRGDMNFNPIFFHGDVEKITGYPERDLAVGMKSWEQLIHPEDLTSVFTEDEEKLYSIPDYSYEREYRILRKDGKVRWVHEVVQNICDDLGKPTMLQGVIRDITERKGAEKALLQKDKKLQDQTRHLQEVNIALKVLIERREEEKKAMEENMVGNVTKLLYPYLEKLERAHLGSEERTYVDIIKSNLENIISPLANALSSKYYALTPKEIEVANLINQGKTSKEIAVLLKVSPKTIMFHRDSIRRKLGLSNKKINLRSYLHSFPQ